jgi:hypothetical protein
MYVRMYNVCTHVPVFVFTLYKNQKGQLPVPTVRETMAGNLAIHRELGLYIPFTSLKDTGQDTVA